MVGDPVGTEIGDETRWVDGALRLPKAIEGARVSVRVTGETAAALAALAAAETGQKVTLPDDQAERVKVLSAFSAVDYITIFNESTPLKLIKKLKPDILIKGADWTENSIVGADILKKYGGKIVRVPIIPSISTSALIAKIRRS